MDRRDPGDIPSLSQAQAEGSCPRIYTFQHRSAGANSCRWGKRWKRQVGTPGDIFDGGAAEAGKEATYMNDRARVRLEMSSQQGRHSSTGLFSGANTEEEKCQEFSCGRFCTQHLSDDTEVLFS